MDYRFDVALSVDISRQSRTVMAILSMDPAQCYDRVNHVFMAMLWIIFTRNIMVAFVILSCLQTMEFYQRTGYGDSQDCFGIVSCLLAWMGLGQGSRDASHSWVQLSSLIVNVMKKTGHVAEIRNPITGDEIKSVGSLFVDDANIFVYGDRKKYRSAEELHDKVNATGKALVYLLRATGGALKPVKCFWWLADYRCENGQWEYEDTKGLDIEILGDNNKMTNVKSLGPREEKGL